MSGYPYSTNPSGYYGSSNYSVPQQYSQSVPQYTQDQISAYYQRYHTYPPDYYQQPQMPTASPYAQSASSMYAQPPPTSSAYDQAYLSTTTQAQRPRSPRTFPCEIPNCTSTANFTRLADLQRHQSTVHGMGTPAFPCYVEGCSRVGEKGFTRRDHLTEHLRNFHHLDIRKRLPGERTAHPMGLPELRP